MKQLEINNLVNLLMSGDKQNILMAKAICEEQKRMDIIQKAFEKLINKRKTITPFTVESSEYGMKYRVLVSCIFGITGVQDLFNVTASFRYLPECYRKRFYELVIITQNYYNSFALSK